MVNPHPLFPTTIMGNKHVRSTEMHKGSLKCFFRVFSLQASHGLSCGSQKTPTKTLEATQRF